jgi:ribosomal protein S18 acetylase RimI-like enzyme
LDTLCTLQNAGPSAYEQKLMSKGKGEEELIRPAAMADAQRIAEINVFGCRNAYRGIVPDSFLFRDLSVEKTAAGITRGIESGKGKIYVSDEDGLVKGFSILADCRDEDKKGVLEIALLYVDPAFMYQGIGTKLNTHAESIAKARESDGTNIPEMVLWVLERNASGISFYLKNGYCEDGSRKYMDKFQAWAIRMTKLIHQ